MRTTIAIIKLVLRTNKTLSSGEHPIMLRCSYHGMKERSTGYSCSVKYWDKTNQCIKKGYSNYIMVNHELNRIKNEAISRRDKYIANDEVYTPDMILDTSDRFKAVVGDLPGLIQRYIDDKGLENKTIEKWWIVSRSINRFCGRNIIVSEINESFCRRYARWLESEGLTSGSIRSYLGKVGAICHYAISLGLMSSYPFSNWKYHKDYRESKNELYIHSRAMDVMIEMFLNEVIIQDGNRWKYRDGVISELLDIHSIIYSHYLYLITYYLCGISPLDVSLLKKSDIKVIDIKGESCYAIDGYRSKTGMLYKIRVKKGEILSQVLVNTMLMFKEGDYFLPTLEGYIGKNIKKRVNNIYTYHGENLVNWFRQVNEEIVKRNVGGDNIELIDLDCRYYSARHSYIMGEIQKPNVNLLRIATVTGKSVQTLHQYLSYLGDLDLI